MDNEIKPKHDNGVIISLVLSLVLIWSGFYFSYPDIFKLQQQAEKIAMQKTEERETINKVLAFGRLNLEAKAFAIYDIEKDEIIAGQREKQVLPLASITKVMTVLVADDLFSPMATIVINKTTSANNGGLRLGEKWSLANLAALTLVSSSNDGATALAGTEQNSISQNNFVNQMNEKSRTLGLNDLHFTNPTGLDDNLVFGGQGSALSVAKLFSYITKNKPELLSATREQTVSEKSLDNFNHTVINTNEIINNIPGLLASKTGYTDAAGGNLAIVANLGLRRPIAIVVLGSSQTGRFTDTQKLVEATLNYYSNLTPTKVGAS